MKISMVTADAKKCTGCKTCEQICSLIKFGSINPKKARLRVVSLYPEPGIDVPITCLQCGKAPCKEACPMSAFEREEAGALVIREDRCIGCNACVEACPFGAIIPHISETVPLLCDLCGGDPECVRFCPFDALHFKTFGK